MGFVSDREIGFESKIESLLFDLLKTLDWIFFPIRPFPAWATCSGFPSMYSVPSTKILINII